MYYLSRTICFIACLAAVFVAHLHPAATTTLRIAAFAAFMLQGCFLQKPKGVLR